jgi:AAA+ superfamily predicted ATPase
VDDSESLIASLLAAVQAAPGDVALRLHVSRILLDRGRVEAALEHCSAAVTADPGSHAALDLLRRITDTLSGGTAAEPERGAAKGPAGEGAEAGGFDWVTAEEQVEGIVEPAFVGRLGGDPVVEDIRAPSVRLADVGGMEEVKRRLEIAFLGPLRNPELARAFRKSLAGGLVLYGPPGCGKTFIAQALAGEVGAKFYRVEIADVLDSIVGKPERHIKEAFHAARRNAPCVLFFDEIDALGHKRSHLRYESWLRTVVNTLLTEMDSVSDRNDGVFVLGATNHPWDMDTALRRPGRFDRLVLVLPPDPPARAAILRYHLRDRPLAGIDLEKVVRATDDFSGADLAHLVDSAAELALAESVRTGEVRPVTMADFTAALREVKPSIGPWLQTARNVAVFGNADGTYDDLLAYMRKRRMV